MKYAIKSQRPTKSMIKMFASLYNVSEDAVIEYFDNLNGTVDNMVTHFNGKHRVGNQICVTRGKKNSSGVCNTCRKHGRI